MTGVQTCALPICDTISRLGIEPLYPPSEDFHVGDVWIVVSRSGIDPEIKEKFPLVYDLLGKSVRVGHVNLSGLNVRNNDIPHFTRTSMCENGNKDENNCPPPLNPIEVDTYPKASRKIKAVKDSVELSLVGFPGVSIVGNDYSSVDFSELGGSNIGRLRNKTTVITIPEATVYSVPVAEAMNELLMWCTTTPTKFYCTDNLARKLLSYSYGNLVNLKYGSEDLSKKGEYVLGIEMKLITRVYLVREFNVSVANYDATKSNYESLDKLDTPENTVKSNGATVVTASGGGKISGKSGAVNDDGLKLAHRYGKPLVLGFRSVSYTVSDSFPPDETVNVHQDVQK